MTVLKRHRRLCLLFLIAVGLIVMVCFSPDGWYSVLVGLGVFRAGDHRRL